jgi:hypothetical protein
LPSHLPNFKHEMAERLIHLLKDLTTRQIHQCQLERQLNASVKTILETHGSTSTRSRKQRASRLLYDIHSKINPTVFIYCASSIGYTVFAEASNADVIEKLLSWWAEVEDTEQLSQHAIELFHRNSETVNKLLEYGKTSQLQQKRQQTIPSNDAPSSLDPTGRLDNLSSSSEGGISPTQQKDQQALEDTNRAPPNLNARVDNSSSVTSPAGLVTQNDYQARGIGSADIMVPWSQLLVIFEELGNNGATLRCNILNSNFCGFHIMLGSDNVAVIQMSPYLSDYTTRALLRPTKTSC